MSIIAIDPGASGGYAISNNGISAAKWTGESDFAEMIENWIGSYETTFNEFTCTAVVEEVPKFVGKAVPSSSIFTLAKNYGWILGFLHATSIPTHLVRPQVWQKGLAGVRAAKGAAKKRVLKDHAARLFPELRPTLATADALLILHYAKHNITLE